MIKIAAAKAFVLGTVFAAAALLSAPAHAERHGGSGHGWDRGNGQQSHGRDHDRGHGSHGRDHGRGNGNWNRGNGRHDRRYGATYYGGGNYGGSSFGGGNHGGGHYGWTGGGGYSGRAWCPNRRAYVVISNGYDDYGHQHDLYEYDAYEDERAYDGYRERDLQYRGW
jgi:hypothetical protein